MQFVFYSLQKLIKAAHWHGPLVLITGEDALTMHN